MDGNKGKGETMSGREMPAELEAVEIKSAQEAREAVEAIGGGDLLNEHGGPAGSSGDKRTWMDSVQSDLTDHRTAALAIKNGFKTIGYVLADGEGHIKQFQSSQGKEKEVLERALTLLQEKHLHHFTVQLDEKNKLMRSLFMHAGFREEKTEDGKIVLKKH
jgi:hypothetical protein